MAEDQDILEPPVATDDQQPVDNGPGKQVPPQPPALKDEDKQQLYKIITKMEQAGESPETIKAVARRYQEIKMAPAPSPVDKSVKETTQKLSEPLQFNGTFKPDLEGEKNGLYLNDPDYQKQKQDFVSRIAKDDKGVLLYPEQDPKSGQWSNYYTKQPIPNFDPKTMRGAILQVPHEYLPATGGQKFITPKYNEQTGSYSFPAVQTPDVPTVQNLPQATVYGKKGPADQTQYSGATGQMVAESDKQGGELRDVLKAHPELKGQIDETLSKYGPEYSASIATGHDAMSNVLQKTVEDNYDLNKPLPENVNADALNSHLNVLNNLDKNKQQFELTQRDLQRQADLLTDRAKRTGQPISQQDAEQLAQKASDNIQKWNEYSKSVQFSQNYVNQPEVKNYLDEFKKRQTGIQLIDELRQRAFPDEVNASMKQDAYDRKAIEGNLNAWDYAKTAMGAAGKGVSNIGETVAKTLPGALVPGFTLNDKGNAFIEKMNNNAQQYLSSNLPTISPDAIEQMNKQGIGHVVNDLSSMVGGVAPYVVPGMAGEGLGAKTATFATTLAEGMPDARKEAEKQGLTGSAYTTYIAAKPLVSAAFMTLLPNVKFAKGFESDVAKAVVDGEFNNPKRALLNLASKVLTVHPGDVAHLQAMLSGTALGEALVNKVTNGLQATENASRGISQKQELPTELSNVFNPRQTAVMALTGKLLEAVPTLKNSISELGKGKDIQGTYDHIQNNLLELAGHNLEGVSNKVNELVKADPGNIYAQHLKTTLEDFAHAEARMPEGMAPEQKAALFDVQRQILQKQRQMAYADPVYGPHLQKNIDELSKQIPDIIKDPKKANDYLASGHKEFSREILNAEADEKLLKSNKQKDLADLKDRESALDQKSSTYVQKKEALDKERAETEDYYDNRIKKFSSPKTENNERNEKAEATANTQTGEQPGQVNEKPTEGADNNNLMDGKNAPSIQSEKWARTLDYGDNKGKEENKEAQDKIKDEILTDKPIGGNGEKFSDLLGRVIPGIQKVMKEDPHNTTVVTHSSVIKALKVWEDMGRPDVSELKGDKLKEFAQKYVDLKPEAEGKVHTFTGENGNDVKVVRHGETEDNKLSEFREDDTKLTDKGEAQAERAGDNLIKETGGDIPKLISSDLPRTMHTSDIINKKLQDHAVQIGRPAEVLQREQGEAGSERGERGRVESGQQGNEPTGESAGQPADEKGQNQGKKEKVVYSDPVSIKGKAAIKEANERKNEVKNAGFDFLAQEDDGGPYNKNRQYATDEVPIGMSGIDLKEQGKGLGTLGYILKGEEYLKQGRHLVSDAPHIPEARTDQAESVWKKLVKLGLATETSPGSYRYGGERESKDSGKEGGVGNPPKNDSEDELPFGHLPVGIAHDAQIDRSTAELDVAPPERGEGITLPESIQKGKDLLKDGADVEQIVKDFKKDGKVSADNMAIVRARYNELADKTNKAYDKYGKDSDEAKAAFKEERDFYTDAVKPMQTEWSKIGVAQQGGVDLDTGSISGLRRAFVEKNGVEPTDAQLEEMSKMAERVKGLEKGVEDLKAKLDEAMKNQSGKATTFTEKTKKAADTFRKLKTKPFTFKDQNGNDVPVQKAGIDWNDLVELGAKAIEASGQIADGISAIIEKVKDADWYKGLSADDKDRFKDELTDHYTGIADENTGNRIKALEKQLADLQQGKVKGKSAKRTETARETELKAQIAEIKNSNSAKSLAERLANKTSNDFTPEEAKGVWDYLNKTYLDKNTPFGDALANTATDLGITTKQVLKALATPKGGKEITTEMFKKQYERRKALEFAKRFVEAGNDSAARKFFRSLPSAFFNLKTYGHGTVGNITHAGPNIFRPSVWGAYWPNVMKSFSLAYGKVGNYEKAVTSLKNSPNFTEWKRAGLAVDPTESYDEYQVFGKKQSWLGEAGTRGFTGLKFMRYDMAEMFYNRASEVEKADPNLRQEIAKLVNHATGHTEIKVAKTIKALTFAPGLEVSRWQRMIGDPAKAINTLATWKKRTPAEQAAAKIVFAGAGQRLATYAALLAANGGLLSALGSKQTINTTDPTKSDWLKFKFGDKTLDMTGGVLGPIRLLSSLTKEAYLSGYGNAKDLRTKPGDKDAQTLFQQARYKLAPLAGNIADVATGTDAMGNVQPWSNIKPGTGRHKLDWFEYATQQLPIPIAAGIKATMDAMQERGMSKPEINDILNGALQFTVEGFTGAKLNEDYSLEQGGTGGGAGASGSYGGGHRQRRGR